MSEIKLLPCPFCGSHDIKAGYFQVWCGNCGVGTDTFGTQELAIQFWNIRKPMERILTRLEGKKRSDGTESDREWGKYIGYVDAIKIVKEEGGIE